VADNYNRAAETLVAANSKAAGSTVNNRDKGNMKDSARHSQAAAVAAVVVVSGDPGL
jgi:hypothetical protein